MIFLNNILKTIDESSLIIQFQANEFYNHNKIEDSDFDSLFNVLSKSEENIDLTESKKNNLLLAAIYFVYDRNENARILYKNNFHGKTNELNVNGTQIDLLHLLFNLIEIDLKYYSSNQDNFRKFYQRLNILQNTQKSFQDNLLYKYYIGVVKNILKEYNDVNIYTSEIILDISDQLSSNKNDQNDLINFIQVKNTLLRVKILEIENNTLNQQDIISHLESLFEANKGQKEDFAIKLAIKMNALQVKTVDCQNCIKTLEELLNILHKEMLFGKTHKNIIPELLYVNGLLGYYNCLIENYGEVKRFANKIKKNLNSLKLFSKNNQFIQNFNLNNLSQYDFIYVVLKNMLNNENKNKEDENEKKMYLNNYMKQNNIYNNDEVVLNFSILNKDDIKLKKTFMNNEEKYKNGLISKKILDKDLLNCYLYLYNGISNLTENILNGKMNNEINKKIRDYCKLVIDFTNNNIVKNDVIKELFRINYFKDLFNRLYFAYLYSFYYQKEYEKCLQECEQYQSVIKVMYELPEDMKSFLNVLKIKGDCYFKTGNYNKAIEIYNNILGKSNDENMNLTIFNLAISFLFMNKKSDAIHHFNKCLEGKINNEMKLEIQKILNKLKN
jgi:hypothetical protein